MAPGRRIAGRRGFRRSTIVDSRPIDDGPPSSMCRILPPRPALTWRAVVGLTYPKGLALGAASGTPASRINFRNRGCAGIRTATLGNPAVASVGTAPVFGRTMVRGPGQNRFASLSARGIRQRHAAEVAQGCYVDDQGVVGRPVPWPRISSGRHPCSWHRPPGHRPSPVGTATRPPARRTPGEGNSQVAGECPDRSGLFGPWSGSRKNGQQKGRSLFELRQLCGLRALCSLREQHVARVLDRARDGPLVLRAKTCVLAGQDLARVCDEADPCRRIREGNLRGGGGVCCLVSAVLMTCVKSGRGIVEPATALSMRQFWPPGAGHRAPYIVRKSPCLNGKMGLPRRWELTRSSSSATV